MKSIEIIVPRKLITEFMQHPESYGDYVVMLKNGMYTDVYYREEGDFITITNNEELIHYLNYQEVSAYKYAIRNGVFAFRELLPEDSRSLSLWGEIKPVILSDKITLNNNELKRMQELPRFMMLSFYWIEVGTIELLTRNNILEIQINIYESNMIDQDNIETYLLVIKEYLNS